METLRQHIADVVGSGLTSTKNPEHGDYQWNGAFKIAKTQRLSAQECAEEVAQRLRNEPCFSRVEVAGNGFVNLTLDAGWLADWVAAVVADPYLGVPQDNSQTVVVDYSSPNVAKRMHVGHLRSTIIGAAIVRLNDACGHRTIGDNHVGDWGTQFGKLIVAWTRWGSLQAFDEDPVGELEWLYVQFNDAAEHNAELVIEARAETLKLQQGDERNTALWKKFIAVSMVEYQAVYDRLGVTFDVTLGESAYEADLPPLVQDMQQNGVAVESDGAIVVPFGDEMPPLIVQKSDGAYLYGTTDLAAIQMRLIRYEPDQIVYVTDVRQSLHFRQVFAASAKIWGELIKDTQLVHVGFGMLRFPKFDGVSDIVSSRKGNTIPLTQLLNKAHARARIVLDKDDRIARGIAIDDPEKVRLAEAIGISAVIYADLSRPPASDVTFDWDRVLSLDGNSAPYLLYAYARCCGIIRKIGDVSHNAKIVVATPEERRLALVICQYPDAIIDATIAHGPNILASYAYDLVSTFSKFYDACQVTSRDGVVDASRLGFVRATAQILRACFHVLGLRPLERM